MDKKQKGVEFYQNNFDKYEIRKKGMIDDKKWTVCLSIIILVLNFVPNLLQGHQVFAENQKNYKDKVELINDESFNISYSMQALENQYEWEIDYRINKTENDKELKLKFSFEGISLLKQRKMKAGHLKKKIQ